MSYTMRVNAIHVWSKKNWSIIWLECEQWQKKSNEFYFLVLLGHNKKET